MRESGNDLVNETDADGERDERTAFCGDGRKFGSSFPRELCVRPTRATHTRKTDRPTDEGRWPTESTWEYPGCRPPSPKYTDYVKFFTFRPKQTTDIALRSAPMEETRSSPLRPK